MRLQQIYLYSLFTLSLIILTSTLFCDDNVRIGRYSQELRYQPSLTDSLPDNIPFVKNILWGKRGLVRKLPFTPKSRVKELKLRRDMLQLHQKLALITLGLMSYQYYIGNEMVENNTVNEDHMVLGYTTFGAYMSSASLSILSPPASKYTKRLSSLKIHKYLSVIHFIGMCVQPWLGYQTYKSNVYGDLDDYDDWLELHQQVGGITMTCYALAFLTTLLPY